MRQGGFDFADPYDSLLRAATRLGFDRTRGVLRGTSGELAVTARFAEAKLSDEEAGLEITLFGAALPSGMVLATPRLLPRSDLVPIGDPELDGALLVGGDVAEGLACLDADTRATLAELVVGRVELSLSEGRLRFFDARQRPSEGPVIEDRIRRVMRLGKRLVAADEQPVPAALLARFREDPVPTVRHHALERLALHARLRALTRGQPRTPEAEDALEEALVSDDVMARVVASSFVGERGRAVLVAVLDTTGDDEIAAAALRTLATRLDWHDDTERRLVDVVERADDEALRRAACGLLGPNAGLGAVEPLLEVARGLMTSKLLRADALAAVLAIQSRHGGAAGQLSVTLSDGPGQLSMPDGDDGALSLPEGGELSRPEQ